MCIPLLTLSDVFNSCTFPIHLVTNLKSYYSGNVNRIRNIKTNKYSYKFYII